MIASSFNFWQKWLVAANVFTLMVGLSVAFAGNSQVFDLHNQYTQEVFFYGEIIEKDSLRFKNWLFGIIGGTIVGFHLLMLMIVIHPFKNKEKWSYWALWMGLLGWFLIDTAVSIYYKAYHNVLIINIPAAILLGLPLLMTFSAFFDKSPGAYTTNRK